MKFTRQDALDIDTEAFVDTGFSSDIALPAAWIKNGHRPDAYATWTMADGSKVMAPISLGTIQVLGLEAKEPLPMTITVLGDELMAGRGLIDHFKLTFDHGKVLIIKK